MGMDVFGNNPKSETGEYFRNNVWWWRPLADYCLDVAPEICDACKFWHDNSGDGLDERGATELAEVLQNEIDSGRAAQFERDYIAAMDAMPDEHCTYCNGTGIREWDTEQKPCNGCEGKGVVRPFFTWYPFSVENLQQFANFLRDSGGFEIH